MDQGATTRLVESEREKKDGLGAAIRRAEGDSNSTRRKMDQGATIRRAEGGSDSTKSKLV